MSLLPRSALFPYQPAAIARMVGQPQLAVLLKMGLGKTVCTLTALHDRGRPRTLVVAPAGVAKTDVWGKEARSWEHLAGLEVVPLTGSPAQRQRALARGGDVEVVSYENLMWLTDNVEMESRYQAIVFDELSKLKTAGSKRFKRMRSRLGGINIPVRYGLTGTPVGNHLLDLWGEMYMVAGEKPLGPSKVDYQLEYFHAFDPDQRNWEPNFGAAERIMERVKPWAFSLDEKLAGDRLPALRVNPVEVELPLAVQVLLDDLSTKCRAALASGATLEALSAASFAAKARQLSSGAIYTDPLNENAWETVHTAKLDRLEDMVESAQGEPVLVFYWYRHELARLRERFPAAREAREPGAVDAWNRREVEVLLAHPQSAGHGLNLQHGGSQACWYTLPYSHELWGQGNGRLARVGQTAPQVVANALLAGDADWAVLECLRQKGEVERQVLDGVRLLTEEDLADVLA